MKKLLILILSLVFILSGCGLLAKPEAEPETDSDNQTEETPPADGKGSELPEGRIEELIKLAVEEPFPDFSGETLDGGTLDTKDLRGNVIVVNLLATWCGWCTYELPYFADAIEHFEGKEVKFVGIDVWEDFSNDTYKTELKTLLDEAGIDMPVLLDKDGSYANSLGIQGIPFTMIVDTEGMVRFVNPGAFMSSDDLIAMVDMVLYHSDRF